MKATNERLAAILAANPKTLARIDAILDGEDSTSGEKHDADCRTVTFTDAARRMGVSRMTIYRLVKAGRLRVVPLLGVNRIALSSVEDYANGKGVQ